MLGAPATGPLALPTGLLPNGVANPLAGPLASLALAQMVPGHSSAVQTFALGLQHASAGTVAGVGGPDAPSAQRHPSLNKVEHSGSKAHRRGPVSALCIAYAAVQLL